jgi:hypothetical protein
VWADDRAGVQRTGHDRRMDRGYPGRA